MEAAASQPQMPYVGQAMWVGDRTLAGCLVPNTSRGSGLGQGGRMVSSTSSLGTAPAASVRIARPSLSAPPPLQAGQLCVLSLWVHIQGLWCDWQGTHIADPHVVLVPSWSLPWLKSSLETFSLPRAPGDGGVLPCSIYDKL